MSRPKGIHANFDTECPCGAEIRVTSGKPEPHECEADRRDASAEVAAAFANIDATKRKLVARAAGVDPDVARELGY